MTTHRPTLLAIAALAAMSLGARGGCGPASPPVAQQTNTCAASTPPPANGLAAVQLGRDVSDPFQPLVDGDAMPINHGPQGGQHVYVTVRLYAPTAASWTYALAIKDTTGASVGSTTIVVDACGGWNESQKVRVFLDAAIATSGALSISASPSTGSAAPLTESVMVNVTGS